MKLLGGPFKLSKFRGGFEVDWIGLHIHNQLYSLGLSIARAVWLADWIDEALKVGSVPTREMAGGLGRINFAASALCYERPFLGPLYLWVSAIQQSDVPVAVLPWAIRLILKWIATRLRGEGRLMVAPSVPKSDGEWFRSDAKAEDGRAFVGGWKCAGNTAARDAAWFYLELTPTAAPWVFAKAGDPGRTIASLELLGTLLCLILFDIKATSLRTGSCSITGSTDNQGNTMAMLKLMSTKWPLATLLIELSEQLRSRQLDLNLAWLPRLQNQEADDITNQNFEKFDASRRVRFEWEKIQWLVLDDLMQASQELYQQVVAEREVRKTEPKPTSASKWRKKMSAKERLKNTKPW